MDTVLIALTSALVCYALFVLPGAANAGTPADAGNHQRAAELIAPDRLKEDLDFLLKTVEQVHPNMYAYTSEEDFTKRRQALYQQIDRPMTSVEFFKVVAPVVASLKNGHTAIWPVFQEFNDYVKAGGKVFPLTLTWDGKHVILKDSAGEEPLAKGATVLEINGEKASGLILRLARWFPAERRDSNPHFVMDSLPLLLWTEYGWQDTFGLKLRLLNGDVKSYIVKAVSSSQLRKRTEGKAPYYTYQHLPEDNVGLIKLKKFADMPRYKKFLNATFRSIRRQGVSNLIIDIRNNPGGSSQLGDALLEYLTDKPVRQFETARIRLSPQLIENRPQLFDWLKRKSPEKELKPGATATIAAEETQPGDNPLRFRGRTFVLIGPLTYSSSVSFASAIKCYGIGALIGEETGDPTTCYGDCCEFRLPHSGLLGVVACQYFVQVGGKDDGRGVLPDYEVKQKPEDTAKGIDTVLQFTLDLVRRGSKS